MWPTSTIGCVASAWAAMSRAAAAIAWRASGARPADPNANRTTVCRCPGRLDVLRSAGTVSGRFPAGGVVGATWGECESGVGSVAATFRRTGVPWCGGASAARPGGVVVGRAVPRLIEVIAPITATPRLVISNAARRCGPPRPGICGAGRPAIWAPASSSTVPVQMAQASQARYFTATRSRVPSSR